MPAEQPAEQDYLVDAVLGDRYRVLRKISEGGMSSIYEVQHVNLMRSFAMKALLPSLVTHTEAVERFIREAELLGSLRHRNVVAISDFLWLPDGTPCMVLEFLHGASLQVRLLRSPMTWDAIAKIGDQTMSALALSHRLGITHRDLKPENVFIAIDDSGDEQAKVLDFGISKLRGVGKLSGVHKMLGTPSYMAPEQLTGNTELIGPHTDVWAMGTILYEMATQQVAFRGQDVMQTLELIQMASPPPISNYRSDVPAEFVDLVDRAISRDPERRLQTIEELRDGLQMALPRKGTKIIRSPQLTPKPMPVVAAPQRTPVPTPMSSAPFVGTSKTPPGITIAAEPSSRMRLLIIAIVAALLITAGNLAIALLL